MPSLLPRPVTPADLSEVLAKTGEEKSKEERSSEGMEVNPQMSFNHRKAGWFRWLPLIEHL